jgi:hypothetical protein
VLKILNYIYIIFAWNNKGGFFMEKSIVKNNKGISFVNLVFGVALIFVAYILISNHLKINSPVKKFIKATTTNDEETMLAQIDLAGMTLFDELDSENLDDFWDSYQDYIESDEWKKIEEKMDTYKVYYENYISKYFKTLGYDENITYSLDKVNSQEKVSENLYKVEVTLSKETNDSNTISVIRIFYVMKKDSNFYIVGVIN